MFLVLLYNSYEIISNNAATFFNLPLSKERSQTEQGALLPDCECKGTATFQSTQENGRKKGKKISCNLIFVILQITKMSFDVHFGLSIMFFNRTTISEKNHELRHIYIELLTKTLRGQKKNKAIALQSANIPQELRKSTHDE